MWGRGLFVLLLGLKSSHGDFVFPTFHDTVGLVFNGDVLTTSCANETKFSYGDIHQANRERSKHDDSLPDTHGVADSQLSHNPVSEMRLETETNPRHMSNDANAVLGHRDDFVSEQQTECAVRVRMTPSQPYQRSATWYAQALELYSGFECGFRFQISDLSRTCNYVKDRNFGTASYKACRVHGGDGFAFVAHAHPNGTGTMGRGGAEMGYGGIDNSLAVEFDTWYNPDLGDLFDDHVSVQSRGAGGNEAGAPAQLGISKIHPIADGREHVVKVRYYPTIKYQFLDYFTATPSLLSYIADNAEMKRVGTLAVWMDNMTAPIMAMPINLSKLLDLPQGSAYVGFTSSTGESWEKHDLLGWYCCEAPPCMTSERIGIEHSDEYDFESYKEKLDYHQEDLAFPTPVVDPHGDNSEMVSDFTRAEGLAEPHALHEEDELTSNYPHPSQPHGQASSTRNEDEQFNTDFVSETHRANFELPAVDQALRDQIKATLLANQNALKAQQKSDQVAAQDAADAALLALQQQQLAEQAAQHQISRADLQTQQLNDAEQVAQQEILQAHERHQLDQQHDTE